MICRNADWLTSSGQPIGNNAGCRGLQSRQARFPVCKAKDIAPANQAHFTLDIPGIQHDFKVLAFRAREAISQCYRIELLVAVSSAGALRDITGEWDATVASEWLPLEKGVGLKLTGDVTELHDDEHLEVRVLYYSPLAMVGGAMSEERVVVGGRMGVRYVIKGNNITVHVNHDGTLPSDRLVIEEAVAREKLQPEGNV